jgi:hypothetical protein
LVTLATREYRIVDAASARYASSIRVRTRFVVDTAALDIEVPGRTSSELSRLSQECGCDMGARFLMISILVCSVASVVFWKAWWTHPILFLVALLLACFLSAGIGKAIGIHQAKRELRARLLSLYEHLERQEAMLHGMHR